MNFTIKEKRFSTEAEAKAFAETVQGEIFRTYTMEWGVAFRFYKAKPSRSAPSHVAGLKAMARKLSSY